MSSRLHRRTCAVVARPRPAPRGGGGAGAGVGRPRRGGRGGHRLAGGGEGPSECVYAHACQRCAEALLRRTVVEHAGPVCPGLQTLPLRAAFAPTGAFGSACFVVSERRWRGTRPRCGTRGVCADLARNPHGPCYRFPSSCRRRGAPAEGAAQRVCAESVLFPAATETATTPAYSTPAPSETTTTPAYSTPTPSETATTPAYGTPAPSETATTPVARQGSFLRHFGQAGAVGVSQNPQADDAGAVGVSSSDPAAPRDGGDVTDCRLSREAPAR